ncbi:NAD(P)(+) transhydrogenase (Re/Si-specific) subunit beta [Emticicia sp. 17c]|uniref:NAD(P)(+) transhydrogenase (Re/Si-specific) subunit beta n=1 Tax=Emticicia sp. 17c TaxID=3127704 RepID=UPI00301E5A2A
MEIKYILDIVYLIASVTFVMGLKMLSHPDTARKGNLYAAFGMALAIAGTILLYNHPDGYTTREPLKIILILVAISIGSLAGWLTANRVQMTKMPELVSLFNGMGGACAALIGIMEYEHNVGKTGALATIIAGMIIGSVSFSGSVIAFLKLNETMRKPIRLPSYNILNTVVMIALIAFGAYIVYAQPQELLLPIILFVAALIYGVLFVIPIGGADMPVVISLLNSFTGLAAAFGGFLYQNQVMLTGGILVGSAGTILTLAMCKAMNRPLSNVIFGAFGASSASTGTDVKGSIKDISISDTAILMNYAKKVVIVPGYGLAVAQAQHVIHELETLLEERGVDVQYAIHPVAGRMPGHMNVLLAESNVSYDKLVEMEDINPEFAKTDVVLVVGANDVVNPAAKTDPSSPIFGMPILDVENARNVIVNKRSMNAGYAGIDNLLFYQPKTSMLFGDAKGVLTKLVSELKQM